LTEPERNEPVLVGTQTLDRALSVLFEVGASGSRGLSLADCVTLLGFSKPTTFRILRAFEARNLLVHDRDRGVYTLGPMTLHLGMDYLESHELRAEALPTMRSLAAETGETIHLGILDGGTVVYIEKVDSPQSIRMFSRIGSAMPAHSTGLGKAMLAWLPEEGLVARLPERLEPRTPATITSRDQLIGHLRDIRARGYSTDDMENEAGIRCVGAPIFDHTSSVCAGLSIAGPANRLSLDDLARLGRTVREASAAISARIGHRPDDGQQATSLVGVGASDA
jgi:IclR family acetate operon transcriptional repressor